MSDPNWRPGKTLNIGETEINATPLTEIFIHPLGMGDGSGRRLSHPSMGPYGSTDSWGLTDGPRRGLGQGKIPRISPMPSARQSFLSESAISVKFAEQENDIKNNQLDAVIQKELESAIATTKASELFSPLDNAKINQHVTLRLIQEKIALYQQLTITAYSIYEQNPFYLMKELSSAKLQEALAVKGPGLIGAFKSSVLSLENAYAAALELKLHDNAIKILSTQLPELAAIKDRLEEDVYSADHWMDAINNRTHLIITEFDIRFLTLPEFLKDDIITQDDAIKGLQLSELLELYISAITPLIIQHNSAIRSYAQANTKISPPLSKPELEALRNLVNLQATSAVGPRWADYHSSLLHSESARHLTELSKALTDLHARAQVVAQLRAEKNARYLAQQHAAKEAHEETIKVANTYSAPAAVATTRPLILGYGGNVGLSEWASSALQAAIQRSVTRVLSHPLIAAALALAAYSPQLGNGELKGASIPLHYITNPTAHDWQTVSGSHISLPVRLSIGTHDNGSTLYATSTGSDMVSSDVRVIPATWDGHKYRYSATLADTSRTTLTWTPSTAPGSETPGSPGLPIEQPPLVVYAGGVLTPVEPQSETYPAIDDVSFDDYIIWFPQDSGLTPVYVMLKSRRDEPGVVTGNGVAVAGTWLGEGVHDRGIAIPAHIADQLRGREFASFDAMRNTFWGLIGTDEALLMQFAPGNRGLIKRGLAPKALEADWVRGRSTFELHHVHEIQDGGDVYNIDNLRIVTPKAHVNYYEASQP